MTSDDEWVRERAELAVSNAECGAQLEVKDEELRDSFVRNIIPALQDAIDRTRASERAHALEAEAKEAEQVHEIWSNAFNSFLISLGIPRDAVDYSPGEDTEGTVGHIVGQAEELAHRMQEQAVAAERERLLGRLREPDEPLVTRLCEAMSGDYWAGCLSDAERSRLEAGMRLALIALPSALAATLADTEGR